MADIIGQILWFGMFFTPVITIPLAWTYFKGNTKAIKILIGLICAFILSFIFYSISLSILLRDGLGPT
jgi:multisubunit Na+/H+ antiporter MnhE subunit